MFSLFTLKKVAKTMLLSVVVFAAWLVVPTVASAQLFTTQSGVGRIKTVNWSATGNDTFDVVTGFQFEESDTSLGELWNQIYQRVEGWATGLHFGPTTDAGTFIIRTYESDSTGRPIKQLDTDKNPQDTLITIPAQDVRYTNAGTLTINPINQASNIAQGVFGLEAESPTTLSFFYKYPKGNDAKVGSAEIVETRVKTKNTIAPGGYVTIDFWYCAQREFSDQSIRDNILGTNSLFADDAGGLVIDAASQQIDGVTKLRSSSALFPGYDFSPTGTKAPCASYLNESGTHAIRERNAVGIAVDQTIKSVLHGTYFRIGKGTYQIPTSAAQNTTEQQNTSTGLESIQNKTQNQEHGFLPGCGVFDSESSIMGCIAQGVYYIIYVPIQWFAGILGQLFDFFLGYSLSDASYRAQFAVRGWQIVRDLSNIFFIIILVYTGLMAVFGSGPNMKKVVPQLILNALLINFSLFGTRVIIDISNVVARVFYKSVHVCTGECKEDLSNIKQGPAGYTPLSEKILSAFNPQQLMSTTSLSQAQQATKNTVAAGSVDRADGGTFAKDAKRAEEASASTIAGYFIIVSLIAALIMFGIAMMFWKTAFFFLGRVIGLYIAMIFAPFAVLSRSNMPIVSGVKKLSWSTWSEDLIKYAMLAPVFVFFLYIIYSFLDTNFLKVTKESIGTGSFFLNVLSVAIPMLIVYYMIREGVKIAEDYAGDFGKKVTGFMNKTAGFVGGAALGVATGGVALAGRNILGRVGARVAGSGALQNASARGGIRGWLADRTMQVGSGMSRATYDARNTTAARNFQRATGTNLNGGINRLFGTGTNRTAGGFTGAISREVATETARAQRFQLTGQQAVVQDNLNRAWESAYQTARNTAQQNANAQGQVFDENNFRANYETQQAAAGNARPDTSAQINRRREQQNNARLTRGTVLARISRTVTNRFTAPTGAAGVAANALGATIAGNLGIAAATVVGQGAIENAAQQQVAQARAGAARAPLNPTQVANLQNRLTQLQNELTRRITLMNSIGGTFAPPISYANLTAANIIDYQTDRQNDINNLQQTIDLQQDFIDRNQNNPAQANAVNTARAMIRRLQNDQNTHRNNIRQAGTVLAEYTRIQNDIDAARTQLANN